MKIKWDKEKDEIFKKAPSLTYIYNGTEFKMYSNDPFIKEKWEKCEEGMRIRPLSKEEWTFWDEFYTEDNNNDGAYEEYLKNFKENKDEEDMMQAQERKILWKG